MGSWPALSGSALMPRPPHPSCRWENGAWRRPALGPVGSMRRAGAETRGPRTPRARDTPPGHADSASPGETSNSSHRP